MAKKMMAKKTTKRKKYTNAVARAAIQEIRERFVEDKRAKQKQISQVTCPDCGAWLNVTSSQPLPDDIKIEFVKHRI
jgi:uncharacterized protein YlaI